MVNYPEKCRFLRLDINNKNEASLFDALLDQGDLGTEITLNDTKVAIKHLRLVDWRALSMTHILVVVQITRDAVTSPVPAEEEHPKSLMEQGITETTPKDFNEINRNISKKLTAEADAKIDKKNAEIETHRAT